MPVDLQPLEKKWLPGLDPLDPCYIGRFEEGSTCSQASGGQGCQGEQRWESKGKRGDRSE